MSLAHHGSDAFKEAHGLINSLISSYGSKDDVHAIMEVHRMVQEAMSTAHDREQRVQEAIRGLSERVADREVVASYSDAKSAHQARLSRLNRDIQADKDQLQSLADDLRVADDQHADLVHQEQELHARKAKLQVQEKEDEPRKVHQISLYVHITKLAFAFETLNQRVQQATISDPAASEIVKVELDSSKETPFEMANRIWDLL